MRQGWAGPFGDGDREDGQPGLGSGQIQQQRQMPSPNPFPALIASLGRAPAVDLAAQHALSPGQEHTRFLTLRRPLEAKTFPWDTCTGS